MNNVLRGFFSGLAASLIVGVLYFVDYGPGNGLYGVAGWFALNNKDTGRPFGFLILLVLGALFGLIFGLLQRNRETPISRAIVTGLALGIAWWVIFALLVATLVGHVSLARLNLASFLYPFTLCLVYGLLLGTIYFQSTVRRAITMRLPL